MDKGAFPQRAITDPTQALAALDAFTPDLTALGIASEKNGLPVPALINHMRSGLAQTDQNAIHTGATSQDVIDTAMVLCLREMLTLLTPASTPFWINWIV